MAEDLISRQAAMDTLKKSLAFSENELDIGEFRRGCIAAIRDDIGNINHLPALDAVEVVRCKDCEWAKPYDRGDGLTGYYCQHPNSTFLYGTNWERIFEPVKESSDFCSHAKKKEAHNEC